MQLPWTSSFGGSHRRRASISRRTGADRGDLPHVRARSDGGDGTGSVLLSGGNAEGALPVLRAACQRWLELAAPIEAARVCERLAEAYESFGDDASAAAELARAQATYRRLGVRAAELPGGLSRREAEVLALLAAGRSNREIAEELVISDRTVARHLTNIYRKIAVTSRTQAARYAIDHGLATIS